jgi:serine protease AprX
LHPPLFKFLNLSFNAPMTIHRSMGLGVLLLAGTLAGGAAANAGEFLKLKSSGSVNFRDRSQEFLSQGSQALDQDLTHFVMQFNGRISESDKQALASQNIEVERYIPEDALLVRATEKSVALAKLASSRIRAVGPFSPEWKISTEFRTEPSRSQAPELLMISTMADTSARETARDLGRIPGVVVQTVREREILVSASQNLLAEMARIDSVEWIQRAPVVVSFLYPGDRDGGAVPQLAVTGYESGTRLMGFEAAWSRGFKGQGQIASVADTGLDSGDLSTIHPDFKDTLLKGYLMGMGTESWEDSIGHGTHVSGSVVGAGQASNGAFKGGAYEGRLLFEGLWSALLDNLAPSSDFNLLIGTVYKDGARIHSNSWGNARNFGDYDMLAMRVDEYMWENPEMLVLFAAGNSGEDKNRDGHIDQGSIGSPGTAKNVLTVGASENLLATGGMQKKLHELRDGEAKWGVEPLASDKLSDNPNGIAAFSSRGPTNDGRLKPEIVAPGTNIVSTRSHHPKASKLWGEYDANYAYAGGTSMATPLTAGAATVLRQFLVEARKISDPSAALVKATLMHTATDLYPGQYGTGAGQELPTRRPNVHEGYGRVNMDLATALGDETQLIDDKAGVGLSEENQVHVTVTAAGILRATLAYTDAPASASASQALVNDLDLQIQGADGKTYRKQDRLNNNEMLELTGLPAGSYTVSVLGVNVPQGKNGKQPYALVVSTQ